MRLATKLDRTKVVNILAKSFSQNATLLFLTRSPKHIRKVAEYAFDFALRRHGVYLSDSENGVAICYEYSKRKKDVLDYFYEAKLFFRALSIPRISKILTHTKTIEQTRPTGNYLYFWFFGARAEEMPKVSARELYVNILKLAKKKKLDIYAETTILKNKNVYERFGFEVYKQWFNPESGFNVWFMRKKFELQ